MIDFIFLTLLPIELALLFLSAFAVYVFIKAPVNYWLRVFLIPAILGVAAYSYIALDGMLGYAVPVTLPDSFQYLDYHTIVKNGHKYSIEIWLGDKHRTRLVVVPYKSKLEEVLQESESKKSAGPVIVSKKKGEKGAGNKGNPEDDYESNLILPDKAMPKDQLSNE